MKIVRVQYTISVSYVEQNQENIKGIVAELKQLAHPGIKYSTYLLPDGKSFMHLDHFTDEAAHEALTALPSFKKFADELDANGFEAEPKLEILEMVSATDDFFD